MRDDFFYRLCSNVIEVPALRERIAQSPSELPELVAHLCARITGNPAPALAEQVTAKLTSDLGPRYAFPGNVRELEQCVRRTLMTGSCKPDDKLLAASGDAHEKLVAALREGALGANALVERYCALLYERSHNYVEVARITGLDRRTVKKHIESQVSGAPKAAPSR
jgi:transcriptional regulator with GAF, ATPase, and Fis domain